MTGWSGLAPAFTWRKSQRHLLELCSHVTDRRWHLCAPPGSGKTLIGLELARRLGERTLVLSPTTAIRNQWRSSTALFGADPDTFASTDLDGPAQLHSVTYQLLGNPGAAEQDLRAAARRLWSTEVAAELGAEAAAERISTVERDDPARAKRELNRHVRALRRSLSTGEHAGLGPEQLLGAGPAALIDRIAGLGIGCLVLDECHHLLDWWALVVNALVERLDPVAVIGLTATLPDPDTAREKLNYAGLLGPVDAELHLAAMVAEGGVAPWRDGVRVAELEPSEAAFLDTWSDSFAAELDAVLLADPFITWAVAHIESAAADARDRVTAAWDHFWDRDPLLAAAVARWWSARGMALPAGFDPPAEADVAAPLSLDDRLLLADAWLHAPDGGVPPAAREELTRILRRHGVAVTAAGIRWTRSTADIVCSRSSAKGRAAGEVLAREAAVRGDRMRALVAVERDRATSPPAALRASLGTDAGTAARVLAAVCEAGEVVQRGVICVTGRGAWCDALGADRIQRAINLSTTDGRWVDSRGCDIPAAVELVGRGAAWEPAHWLRAARAALEDGAAHTLVATRGLVGEGWNYPGLNVLVDLTEVASPTATTQLRGRALRIDPDAPEEVASLWDVVIAHPTAHGDWSRFRRRHARWWGPDGNGGIVTGARKVHPRAADAAPPPAHQHAVINDESAALVADRAGTLRDWATVAADGIATSELRFAPRRGRRAVRVRRRGWRRTGAGTAALGSAATAAASVAAQLPTAVALAGAVGAAAGLLTVFARGRTRSQQQTVGLLGDAVAAGLTASGRSELRSAVVTTTATVDGVTAVISGVDDDAARLWADAFEEAMGPLGTPRWLIATGHRAWRVPRPASTTKALATAFATAFGRYVPGARLIRAGTPEATELALRAARERPHEIVRTLRWRNPR
ncbi:DEAD/DEAH box helicase family protein [Saccharopolyspora indica]|uniref:DEAD/DEAH box helicase family protein n=1 Tax=Saccharopolyspora indica TaxID=1229659 RepID=UPI0022EA4C7A|nr:DEAD/DEAH box helicase family protein [Saccharopolyspora indica]MDA3642706.1 DEAD/DEAH box helicase family protein [Saccharopolyspora indica]